MQYEDTGKKKKEKKNNTFPHVRHHSVECPAQSVALMSCDSHVTADSPCRWYRGMAPAIRGHETQ